MNTKFEHDELTVNHKLKDYIMTRILVTVDLSECNNLAASKILKNTSLSKLNTLISRVGSDIGVKLVIMHCLRSSSQSHDQLLSKPKVTINMQNSTLSQVQKFTCLKVYREFIDAITQMNCQQLLKLTVIEPHGDYVDSFNAYDEYECPLFFSDIAEHSLFEKLPN